MKKIISLVLMSLVTVAEGAQAAPSAMDILKAASAGGTVVKTGTQLLDAAGDRLSAEMSPYGAQKSPLERVTDAVVERAEEALAPEKGSHIGRADLQTTLTTGGINAHQDSRLSLGNTHLIGTRIDGEFIQEKEISLGPVELGEGAGLTLGDTTIVDSRLGSLEERRTIRIDQLTLEDDAQAEIGNLTLE